MLKLVGSKFTLKLIKTLKNSNVNTFVWEMGKILAFYFLNKSKRFNVEAIMIRKR